MRRIMLLPTTKNVNESMSIVEALDILKSYNVEFEVVGSVVEGMYMSENGECVEEQLVPIAGNVTSRQLATIFTQECILEFDMETASLIAQNGESWAEFDKKVEYYCENVETAVELQKKMAKHFGGSSRIDNYVWSWTTESDMEAWAI